jgi:hypothetical protein
MSAKKIRFPNINTYISTEENAGDQFSIGGRILTLETFDPATKVATFLEDYTGPNVTWEAFNHRKITLKLKKWTVAGNFTSGQFLSFGDLSATHTSWAGIGQGAFFWDMNQTSSDFTGSFPGKAKVLQWNAATRELTVQVMTIDYPEAGDFQYIKDAHDDAIHGEIESIDYVTHEVIANGSFPRFSVMTPFKRLAKYTGGSGTTTLSFLYIVQRGDDSKDFDIMMMKDPAAITECGSACFSWFTEKN